jgi:hypothetical protein
MGGDGWGKAREWVWCKALLGVGLEGAMGVGLEGAGFELGEMEIVADGEVGGDMVGVGEEVIGVEVGIVIGFRWKGLGGFFGWEGGGRFEFIGAGEGRAMGVVEEAWFSAGAWPVERGVAAAGAEWGVHSFRTIVSEQKGVNVRKVR